MPKKITVENENENNNDENNVKKNKHAEAMRKWYVKKGCEQMKNKYLHQPEVLVRQINKVKNDEVFLRKLVEEVGLIKLVTLSQQVLA